MPLNTPLDIAPYYDDFDRANNYVQVLFRPGVPLQTRELNVLQSQLQSQIESFGDNIFRRGTIISGCNPQFITSLPYVKIVDNTNAGQPAALDLYQGCTIRSSNTNLTAYVVATATGFVATDPDLNTLFIKYSSQGANGDVTSFVNSEILTIYNSSNSLVDVVVTNGGTAFSNNDVPVFISAITVANSESGNSFQNSTGGGAVFTVGDLISGSLSNAHLLVIGVDYTTNSDYTIVKISPQNSDLSTSPANTNSWTLQTGETLTVNNGVVGATLVDQIGSGAQGTIITDGAGGVVLVNITGGGGQNYYVPPFVGIISGTGSVSTVQLTGQNFIAQINVASVASSTGYGYGFTTTGGIIYQKGYFVDVQPQLVIISKYNSIPDQVAACFYTAEDIIDYTIDPNLVSNATGTRNAQAPGANRMRLTPTLTVVDSSEAQSNDQLMTLVQWSEGSPFLQNRTTQYGVIEQEMAARTFDAAGNFVTNPFLIATADNPTLAQGDVAGNAQYIVAIDPGAGYISGYHIESDQNFYAPSKKGIDTRVFPGASVPIAYGNYLLVNQVGGVFLTVSGDVVSLYDSSASYLAGAGAVVTAPTGNLIGTARVRGFVYHGGGSPGTPDGVYRAHLFDIKINSGYNFKNARSIFYTNAGLGINGIADILTVKDPTTGGQIAQLVNLPHATNQLVFPSGSTGTANIDNLSYTYRTIQKAVANSQGLISVTAAEGKFPYGKSHNLSQTEMADIIIVPVANLVATANLAGSLSVNTSANTVVGSGTSLLNFAAGDYIGVWINTTAFAAHRLTSITNNTFATFEGVSAVNNASANGILISPQNSPISLASHARSANTDSSGAILTVNLQNTFTGSANVYVTFNTTVSNVAVSTKTGKRDQFVKLCLANAIGNTVGPWHLGIPDIFRMKAVYIDTANTVSNTSTNVTNFFYIDHGQNEDYYDAGWLYAKTSGVSPITLMANNYLLVQYDALSRSTNNALTISSYTLNDSSNLATLSVGTSIATLEIPEFYSSTNDYYDLRDSLDFRPTVVNTAIYTANSQTATINPPLVTTAAKFGNTADITNNKKFPVPSGTAVVDITHYRGRSDVVTVDNNGSFQIIKGNPGSNTIPITPPGSLTIGVLSVPPYPSLPQRLSPDAVTIGDTKIVSNKQLYQRQADFTVSVANTMNPNALQPRGYTMAQIANLENRIKNLEYQASLSALQQEITDQQIPSSANAQLNRFLFGFFADNFQNTAYSDLTNPDYMATSSYYQLTSKKRQLNIPLMFSDSVNVRGGVGILPHQPQVIISQVNATDGKGSNGQVTQERIAVTVYDATDQHDSNGTYVEITSLLMSNTSGPADIYFDLYGKADQVVVYQNTTPDFNYQAQLPLTSTANAVLLTVTERKQLTANGALTSNGSSNGHGGDDRTGDWSIQNRPDMLPFPPSVSNGVVDNAGHLTWTHNPSGGRYYQIVTVKYSPHFGYVIYYPFDGSSEGSNTQTVTDTNYYGTVFDTAPLTFDLLQNFELVNQNDTGFVIDTGRPNGWFVPPGSVTSNTTQAVWTYVSRDQKFTISVAGLKPNTTHTFVFANNDETAFCTQINGLSNAGKLVTSANGTLVFDYYYASPISRQFNNTAVITYNQYNQFYDYLNKMAGTKQFSLQSIDLTSTASDFITFINPLQSSLS